MVSKVEAKPKWCVEILIYFQIEIYSAEGFYFQLETRKFLPDRNNFNALFCACDVANGL